jgi:hypothetical protein
VTYYCAKNPPFCSRLNSDCGGRATCLSSCKHPITITSHHTTSHHIPMLLPCTSLQLETLAERNWSWQSSQSKVVVAVGQLGLSQEMVCCDWISSSWSWVVNVARANSSMVNLNILPFLCPPSFSHTLPKLRPLNLTQHPAKQHRISTYQNNDESLCRSSS